MWLVTSLDRRRYAPHLAEAISHLIGTEAYGTYHLVGKGETSWFELAERFTASWGFRHPSDRSQVWPLRELLCAHTVSRAPTSVQAPTILLPPWKEGPIAFIVALQENDA